MTRRSPTADRRRSGSSPAGAPVHAEAAGHARHGDLLDVRRFARSSRAATLTMRRASGLADVAHGGERVSSHAHSTSLR